MKRKPIQTIGTMNTLVYFSMFLSFLAIFLLVFIVLKGATASTSATSTTVSLPPCKIPCMTDRPQTLENPYTPPLKTPDVFLPPIPTRPILNDYSQMGILVRKGASVTPALDMILPLMGRKLYSRRDKYQYYTISNTGNLNTKLPVKFNGQNGMSEYGCDEITSKDIVYVEGYNTLFEAIIYENNSYIYNSLVV